MSRTKTMISYAQNYEDVILDRLFAGQAAGFYVDVGAYDPCENSVTRHFYENGWRGINLEPGSMFDRLVAHRPRDINLRLAASDFNGSMTFVEYPDEPTMSGLASTLRDVGDRRTIQRTRSYEVEVRRLQEIFAEHAVSDIDFMSVDVEGHEKEVLLGNDWSRYRPRALVIEATLPNTSILCNGPWADLLLQARYRPVYFDGINQFYLREEDRHLEPLFRLPPNVFDNFRPSHMVNVEALLEAESLRFRREVQRVEGLRAAEQARAEALDRELNRLLAGTGARSLRLGLAIARCVSAVGSLPRRLPWRRSA